MVTYEIVCDDDFYREGFIAYRNSKKTRWVRVSLKVACTISMLFLAGVMIYFGPKAYIFSALFLFLAFTLTVSHKADLWLFSRRIRRTPFYKDRCTVVVDGSGIRAKGSSSSGEFPWSSITDYVRKERGFVLFMGPSMYYWLPDNSLTFGSVKDVEALILEHGKVRSRSK